LASLAGEAQMPLYDELWAMEGIETIPGGSGLNTTRSANFMLSSSYPGSFAYAGCIGDDERGKTLVREVEKIGVKGFFHVDATTPTGTCAVLIHKVERTLVANLAACLKYPLDHLEKHRFLLEKAKMLYTTSFFITSNYDALLEVARYAAEHNKPLGYGLSANFLIKFNTLQVDTAVQYADYVFGNEEEAKAYAEVHDIKYKSLEEVALAIAKSYKINTKRPRVVIIT
jgi:adenosine kinase